MGHAAEHGLAKAEEKFQVCMTELAELQKFFGQGAKAPATEIFSLWKNFFLEFNKAAEEVAAHPELYAAGESGSRPPRRRLPRFWTQARRTRAARIKVEFAARARGW